MAYSYLLSTNIFYSRNAYNTSLAAHTPRSHFSLSPFTRHILNREIVTDNFDALYAALKPKGVTVSAMLAKAVAEVLKKHPIVNAAYVEGGIKYNKGI
jgi:pyruvate dehydrogenase E2 component (dihydrolipoamide acetyltransferase)